jgi:hypothetical protein
VADIGAAAVPDVVANRIADAPVRRCNSLTASPSSRRWSSVEERFGCSTLSSLRAKGSVKLIANIRSRGMPFDSIRQSVVTQSAA